jgi:hypothetical protein
MKWLSHLFNFYLDASVHVAFAIISFIQVTCITLRIPSDHHLLWFLFFGSISGYNFIKYGVEAEKYVMVANKYHKGIQIFSLVALAIALYHAHFLNINTYVGVFILVLLTGFYALPLLPKAKNLRSWGGLKIFIVALVWAGATVILPVLSVDTMFSWDVWMEATQRFLLVLILLVPFEIRDLAYDSTDLKTLPQRYGVENTKKLGMVMIVLFSLLTFLKDDLHHQEIISKVFIVLLLTLFMGLTKRKQGSYFASFWVESVPIMCYAIMFLVDYFWLS